MEPRLSQQNYSRVNPTSSADLRRVGRTDDTGAAVEERNSGCVLKRGAAQLPSRSLSLLSTSSLRLLSHCSSLDSLSSLGLSFHGSTDYLIEAEFRCAATLRKHGEQVLYSAETSTLYTASSTSSGPPRAAAAMGLDLQSCPMNKESPLMEGEAGTSVRAMAAAGNVLLSSHEDLTIRVWARSGENEPTELHQIAALPTRLDCMRSAMVPGAYVHAGRNQGSSLWIQHTDAISVLAVSRRNGLLYSGSWDRSVKVWRLRDFKCMESFRAHDDAVNALAVSSDGRVLYTASADSRIKAWACRSRGPKKCQYVKHSLVSTLAAHRSAVNALAISHDGSLLYSGACDKAIGVWEIGQSLGATSVTALKGHRHAVLCLAVATIGDNLCSGSADKTIRLWHRVTRRLHTCLTVLEGHTAPIKSLSISSHPEKTSTKPTHDPLSPNCQFSIYSASLDQDVKLWSVKLTTSTCDADLVALQPTLLQGGQSRAL